MPILHSVLNVKALVGAFNQEKALVEAFSVIVKTLRKVLKTVEYYRPRHVLTHVCPQQPRARVQDLLVCPRLHPRRGLAPHPAAEHARLPAHGVEPRYTPPPGALFLVV